MAQKNDFEKPNLFREEDIDCICGTCYNWGITLLELEQPDLSEKFISKALNLIPYSSRELTKEWKVNMQVGYFISCKITKYH